MKNLNHNTTPAELKDLKKGDLVRVDGVEGRILRIDETRDGNRVKRAIEVGYTEWFSGLKKTHTAHIG